MKGDAGELNRHDLSLHIRADMPGLTGPEVESLYVKGARWLKGASIEAIDGMTPRLAA